MKGWRSSHHQLYVSGLSSAFAQHGAKFQVNVRLTVCERSATQKCINLPSSFFRWPGSARRIVDGQTMKFLPPRSTIRPPLPIGLLGNPVAHHVANFIDQVRPRTQANNGDTGLGRNEDTAPNRHTSSSVFQSRSVPMNFSLKI